MKRFLSLLLAFAVLVHPFARAEGIVNPGANSVAEVQGISVVGAPPLVGDAFGSFAGMANGAPTSATTGQPYVREPAASAVVAATVSNGVLVAADSGQATTAAYTGIRLPEEIKSLYADVSFGDANDAAALIATGDVSQASIGASSLHIIFTYNSWAVQWWTDNSGSPAITTVQSANFTAMPFNTRKRIGWRISGTDVYLLLPDGTEAGPVSSSASTTRTNNCFIFEHYRGATGTPGTKFYAVAANLFTDPTAAGRTNVFVAPNNLANAAWIKNSLSGPTPVPPGEQVLETVANDIHWVYQNIPGKAATVQRYTLRFKVKPVGRDWVKLTTYDGALSGQAQRYLNLTTGAYGTASGTFTDQYYLIYSLGSGVYQVEAEYLTNATAGLYAAIATATGDTQDTFVGDITKGMIVFDESLYQRPN